MVVVTVAPCALITSAQQMDLSFKLMPPTPEEAELGNDHGNVGWGCRRARSAWTGMTSACMPAC